MSEHKTGKSNWTDEQKALYWDRRNKGLPGTTKYANVHREIKDEEGNKQHTQLVLMRGAGRSNKSVTPTRQAKQRQAARSNGRGE